MRSIKYYASELYHFGISGQKWGIRRYQNKDGSYKSGAEGRYYSAKKEKSKKTTSDLANEVIRGDWGNGEERKKRLTAAGYNYDEIQTAVNKKLYSSGSSTKTSNSSGKSTTKSKSTKIEESDLAKKRARMDNLNNEIKDLKKKIKESDTPEEKARLESELANKEEEWKKANKTYNRAVESYKKQKNDSQKEAETKKEKESIDLTKAQNDFSSVLQTNRVSGKKMNTDENSMKKYCKNAGIDYDRLSDEEKEYYKHWVNQYNQHGTTAESVANNLIKELDSSNIDFNKAYNSDSFKVTNKYSLVNAALNENLGLDINYYSDKEKEQIYKTITDHYSKTAKHSDHVVYYSELYHHGILGQKWGVRRYQNKDGTLTEEGRRKYLNPDGSLNKKGTKFQAKMETKDTKWASKNYEKITSKAYKQSKKELAAYQKDLSKNPYSKRAQNEYNRHMAEIMNTKVSDLRSPSGKTIKFVAKRGQLGVHMGLATDGYDMSRVKNGVWADGRIAYKKKSVDTI